MKSEEKSSYFRIYLKDDFTEETLNTYRIKKENAKIFDSMYLNKSVLFSVKSKKYVKSFSNKKKIVFTDNIHNAILFKDFTYARKMMVDIYESLEYQSENCIKKNLGDSFENKYLAACIILK